MPLIDYNDIIYTDGSAEASPSRDSSTYDSAATSRRPSRGATSSQVSDRGDSYDLLSPGISTSPSTPPEYDDDLSSEEETEAEPLEQPPLVVVEGFCCATNAMVWGDYRTWLDRGETYWRAERADSEPRAGGRPPRSINSWLARARKPRRVIFAPIGPVSSIHDRACELFYALKGGTIDYGAEHAEQHGHARFGRKYEQGLWEEWSPEKPAHFMGHSLGGPTILKLQSLLREGFFDHALFPGASSLGEKSEVSPSMIRSPRADRLIRSITSVSSPHRGTPLVHLLGSEPLPYPSVRFLSLGDLLAKAVHLATYLDIGPDLLTDAWHFSPRRLRASSASVTADPEKHAEEKRAKNEKVQWDGVSGLLRQLKKSSWAESRDCAPWDCTITAREEEEQSGTWGELRGRPEHKTWYRSYAAYMTMPVPASGASPSEKSVTPHHMPKPSAMRISPLTYAAKLLGQYDFSQISPAPSFLGYKEALPMEATLPRSGAKGKERYLDAQDSPWHLMRRLSSQNTILKTAKEQEPLLGGAVPHLASLGSSAQMTPTSSHGGEDGFFGAVRQLKEPMEQWYASDGVVPLASQYHPGPCAEGKCMHLPGLPGPFPRDLARVEKRLQKEGRTQRRRSKVAPMMQRTDSGAPRPRPWEAPLGAVEEETEENGSCLAAEQSSWSFGAALKRQGKKLAIKVGVPLVEEGADPHFHARKSAPSASDVEAQHDASSSSEELEHAARPADLPLPEANKWHTFVVRDTSHTALCPLWIGTEQQRVFWSGMGSWLASVDEAAQSTISI